MEPAVTVVVITWNGLAHLEGCLPAILSQRLEGADELELIVVDNASVDGSREYLAALAARDRRVRTLLNARNDGFAGPNNQAFQIARGEFVATLNNDAPPQPGWLAALLDSARRDPKIGSVASRMVFAHRPDVIQSTGIEIDRAAIAWDRGMGEPDGGADGKGESVEVFGASAGAALYRREMLAELGGFDRRYFMYLEDVDLAWRARLAGWKAVYSPGATVHHAHSASSKEGSPFKLWHLGRNKLWTIAKCYPSTGLRLYLPVVLAYDLGSLPITISSRRTLAPITGRLAALRSLPSVLKERQHLQGTHPDGWARSREWMQPVASPPAVLARYRSLARAVSGKLS